MNTTTVISFDLDADSVSRAIVNQGMTGLFLKALEIDVEEAARIERIALKLQETEDLLSR